jgi:serine/threonine protein kinase
MTGSEAIGGYLPTAPFHTTGGGQCQWTFARKGGKDFFIKRFLSPTFPLPDGPGSEKTKANKRARCARFEEHHRAIHKRLAPLSSAGGNLIVSRDFLRHGPHYYKITDKVDVSSETPADIAALPFDDHLKILLAVTHSLDILHTHGLVHGDIKPTNILVQRDSSGSLTTKLIDFDNCFVSGCPAPPEEMVGDLWFYAPEMADYVTGVSAQGQLTIKSDIFSLGLVFAEYVTGVPPSFPAAPRYPGEALRRGGTLTVRPVDGREALVDLVAGMLRHDPAQRPTCRQIRDAVQRVRRSARGGAAPTRDGATSGPPATAAVATRAPTVTSALRGKLWERLRDRAAGDDTGPDDGAGASKVSLPRLRGRLLRRTSDHDPPT